MSRHLTQEFNLTPEDVVHVTLSGCESDVFLVDAINYSAFCRGDNFRYYGGHYRASPVNLRAPSTGRWHLVIQPTGGSVRANTQVFRAA